MEKKYVSTIIPIEYELQKSPQEEQAIVLLHGYAQNSNFMMKNFAHLMPKNATLLAPQGPYPLVNQFPLLKRKENEPLFSGHAWYFFDAQTGQFPIDYQTPSLAIQNLIIELQLDHLPTTILAYSQGTYLSIFCAERMKQVQKIIGINGAWRWDKLVKNIEAQVISLNGEHDIIVDPQKSKLGHEKLLENGCSGEFKLVQGETHKLSDHLIKEACKYL